MGECVLVKIQWVIALVHQIPGWMDPLEFHALVPTYAGKTEGDKSVNMSEGDAQGTPNFE